MNYSHLNAATIPDTCQLPRMNNFKNSFGEKLKLLKHWKLPGDIGICQSKIMIRTRLHFPLTLAVTATLVCYLAYATYLLSFNVRWTLSFLEFGARCILFTDNVVIYSKNNRQHFKDIDEVLTLLPKARVSLKLSRSNFFQKKIECLGHKLLPERLAAAFK